VKTITRIFTDIPNNAVLSAFSAIAAGILVNNVLYSAIACYCSHRRQATYGDYACVQRSKSNYANHHISAV